MAVASALLSGAFRISNVGNVFNRTISGTVAVSTWLAQDILLAHGVSELVLSLTTLSAPGVVMLINATSICRVNYSGHASYVSAASAGWQFKDFWGQMGSGISGPTGIHLANSSGDSALVTLIVGM